MTTQGSTGQEQRDAQVSTGPLGRFVRQMFFDYGRSVAPALEKAYVERLRSVPLGFLRAFHEAELERRDPKAEGPPNADEITQQWQEHESDYLNPEKVLKIEIPKMRQQIQQLVAVRVGAPPDFALPLDRILVPSWVKRIVEVLVDDARRGYPDGIPPKDVPAVVASYQKRARLLYDEEIARQFELTPIERQREHIDPRESEDLF